MHGGGAPQVQASARERLAALAEPAVGVLGTLLRRSRAPHVQLGAARDVLDRTGYRAPTRVELEGRMTTTTTELRLDAMSMPDLMRMRDLMRRLELGEGDPLNAEEQAELRKLRAVAVHGPAVDALAL